MFEELDFSYQPSRDVAGDLGYYLDTFRAELIFAVQRFGTRVAMLRLASNSTRLLLAQHLTGQQSILVFRVPDLDLAERDILDRGGQRRAVRDAVWHRDPTGAGRAAAPGDLPSNAP